MSDLRPVGVTITFDEGGAVHEHEILFTLNAIDCAQDLYEEPIFSTLRRMYDKDNNFFDLKIMRTLLTILLNDESEKMHFYDNSINRKIYLEREVGWMITVDNVVDVYGKILQAYRISVPESDDEDSEAEYDRDDGEYPNSTTGAQRC